MAKLCPGQDTRFWRPGDIFEVPCGSCGAGVEFFKDDVYRRCASCGRRVENPKFNLGCAQWCEHAKECLGYDPKETEVEGEGGESLVDRLVDLLKAELAGDAARFARAVRALEYAREILKAEKADAKVSLLAALLHEVGVAEADRREGGSGEGGRPPLARRLLEEAGVHWSVVDRVCRLVGCGHSADGLDTPEARVSWDADTLAALREKGEEPGPEDVEAFVEKRFATKAGRELARLELSRSS